MFRLASSLLRKLNLSSEESIPRRSLREVILTQSGSEVAINQVPTLSAVLNKYFREQGEAIASSTVKLLAFTTPTDLVKTSNDIDSLGTRGVAREELAPLFFKYSAPAIQRYLQLFSIELSNEGSQDFLLKLGRAVRFVYRELPPYMTEVVDVLALKEHYPCLEAFFCFASDKVAVLSPSVMAGLISHPESPFCKANFVAQLRYELETIIYSVKETSSFLRHWRVEEAALRNFALEQGLFNISDPYACLQRLYAVVNEAMGGSDSYIEPPLFSTRIAIAQKAEKLFFSDRQSSSLISERLKIATGERKDA